MSWRGDESYREREELDDYTDNHQSHFTTESSNGDSFDLPATAPPITGGPGPPPILRNYVVVIKFAASRRRVMLTQRSVSARVPTIGWVLFVSC